MGTDMNMSVPVFLLATPVLPQQQFLHPFRLYPDISKAFADRDPSAQCPLGETFSRDPEPCQPETICGSGVSEGYLPAKTLNASGYVVRK